MKSGAKMRVYEIAKQLKVPNKELIAKIRALGMEVNNHMSSLDMDAVSRIRRSLERESGDKTETKRLSSTVLRRRSKNPDGVIRRRPSRDKQPEPETTEPTRSPAVRRPAVTRASETAQRPAVQTRRTSPVDPPSRPAARAPAQSVPKAPERPVAKKAPAAAEAPSTAESAAVTRSSDPGVEKQPVAKSPPAEPAAAQVADARSEPAQAEAPSTPAEPVAAEPVVKKPVVGKINPKAPAIISGPSVVRLPGQPEPPPPAPTPAAKPAAAQARPDRRRRQAESAAKRRKATTTADVTQDARSRFEQELARARQRVSAREDAERQKRTVEEPEAAAVAATGAAPARDPRRPAVGTVISLPIPRIKITERAPTPARQMPGRGQIRGRFANQRRPPQRSGKGGRGYRRNQPIKKGGGKSTQITTPAEHKRVIRMEDTIAIPELAKAMGVKAQEVLKKLWTMGMVGVNINASIDHETAQILTTEFGYEVHNVAFKEKDVFVSQPDEQTDLIDRSPVVTVMGHVDHGKTSLLDKIRKSRVAAGESGGITQHIAAYKVSAGKDYGDVVFLDTPGHEAFTEMRARGAQATDIVVLVVAANDGVKPQTVEAVNHAKDAKVAIIVAVNKCDLPEAQPERVRQQLAEHGLIPEEWGGDTLYIDVSAATGDGVDDLLESISLTAEMLELTANPNKPARGIVIEAKLDRNRGPMATILIQEGTLKTSNIVVAGRYYGKVRAMLDDHGKPIKVVGPSTPIELLGLDGVPQAGEIMNVADDEKVAKQVVEHRRQAHRKKELATTGKISLENLMERIQEGETHELKIVLKADVQGSAEALKASLVKQSTQKVKVKVIQAGVGGVTETDVNLAKAGGAIIVGFHVRCAGKSAKVAEREGVQINLYDVIYEAIDDVRKAMAGLLDPIRREEGLGKVQVRETYTIPKVGTVAGCMVTDGKIQRRSLLRVVRNAVQIYEGRVGSLRRFKDDVAEVKQGFECGMMVAGFNDLQVGDIIEAYEIVEEAAQL